MFLGLAASSAAFLSKSYYTVIDFSKSIFYFLKNTVLDVYHYVVSGNLFYLPTESVKFIANNLKDAINFYNELDYQRTKEALINPNWWQRIIYKNYIERTGFTKKNVRKPDVIKTKREALIAKLEYEIAIGKGKEFDIQKFEDEYLNSFENMINEGHLYDFDHIEEDNFDYVKQDNNQVVIPKKQEVVTKGEQQLNLFSESFKEDHLEDNKYIKDPKRPMSTFDVNGFLSDLANDGLLDESLLNDI